jgi:hypothetical protein
LPHLSKRLGHLKFRGEVAGFDTSLSGQRHQIVFGAPYEMARLTQRQNTAMDASSPSSSEPKWVKHNPLPWAVFPKLIFIP